MDLKAIKFPDVNWIFIAPDVAQWNYAAIHRREYHSLRDLMFSQYCYWDATPCRLVNSYQRYGGPCCFIFSVKED